MSATKLYRHFAKDGTLLYVGVAANGYGRQAQHLGNSKWGDQIARIEFESCPTRIDALAAEREAIAREKPLYNTHLSKGSEYRSARSSPITVRLPEALLHAIDRVAFENKTNRTQAMIVLIEEALTVRENE